MMQLGSVRSLCLGALVGWLGACSDAAFFRHGTPRLDDVDPYLPLSRVLVVELDRPGRLDVELRDSRGERHLRFDQVRDDHRVPLLGFRPLDDVSVTVTATTDDGRATSELSFEVGGLPEWFPRIDVLADKPHLVEPGLRLFSIKVATNRPTASWVMALDESHQVVWAWATGIQFDDLRMHPSGVLYGLHSGVGNAISVTGEVLMQWGESPEPPDPIEPWVEVAAGSFTHEFFPLPDDDGFLTLSTETIQVDDYPCSYLLPQRSCGPAEIRDARVLRFEPDGTVVHDWSMAERLDPFHLGFNALHPRPDGSLDWAHANAVISRPGGGILVSLRHQNALVALDDSGEVAWILGDPLGWATRFGDVLLEPTGEDFRWPYHAHGPSFAPDGTLWVFDNGNDGGTPYSERPVWAVDPVRSRVVGYRVDEASGQVTQVAQFRQTATGELFSPALGNAVVMPTTGNVMGVFGALAAEADVSYQQLGFGARAVRLVEWTSSGEVAGDVRLRSDRSLQPLGWRIFRAVHTPSMYPAGVEAWEP